MLDDPWDSDPDEEEGEPWDYFLMDRSPITGSFFICGETSCWCVGEGRMTTCHCGCHQRELPGGPRPRLRWDGSEYKNNRVA